MKTFKFEKDGWGIRYHDLPGSGTPLLFLHGLGCASSCDYPRVASDAALAGRRRLLIDFLGSGFSDQPTGFGYTVEDHAQAVAALVDHLALPAIDLFGHSMGGSAAIVAAGLLGGRVQHLVLGEPNLDPGGGFFSLKIAKTPEIEYVEHGHLDLIRVSHSEGRDVWAASLATSSAYAVHRGATSLVAGSTPTWREQLYGLEISRAVIFGKASLPDTDTERLPREGVKVEVVPAAGHAMARDNPTGLATAIQRATA